MYYQYSASNLIQLGAKIRETMAQGKFAVVEGCTDWREIDLDLVSLQGSLLVAPNTPLQAHGDVPIPTTFDLILIFV